MDYAETMGNRIARNRRFRIKKQIEKHSFKAGIYRNKEGDEEYENL